jgi:hypothetical protein
MGNVTTARLNSIVESVREQNLFYIQSINETEENIEKQKIKEARKVEHLNGQIEIVAENGATIREKYVYAT